MRQPARRLTGSAVAVAVAVVTAAAVVATPTGGIARPRGADARPATIAPEPTGAAVCDSPSDPAATIQNVQYGTALNRSLHMDVGLYLDYYAAPATAPALILVHAGGWSTGCKGLENTDAGAAVAAGFQVFAIDYLLDCNVYTWRPGDTRSQAMCEDAGTALYTPPDPVANLQTAIEFLRSDAEWGPNPFHVAKNSSGRAEIAVLGASAGGTIALHAAALGRSSGGTDVAAVASWSGSTEVGYLSDETTASCSLSSRPSECLSGKQRYLDEVLSHSTAPDYRAASPYEAFAQRGPAVFLAGSTHELISEPEQTELYQRLVGALRYSRGDVVLCEHDGSSGGRTRDHGNDLAGDHCDSSTGSFVDTTDTIEARTFAFLLAHVD